MIILLMFKSIRYLLFSKKLFKFSEIKYNSSIECSFSITLKFHLATLKFASMKEIFFKSFGSFGIKKLLLDLNNQYS